MPIPKRAGDEPGEIEFGETRDPADRVIGPLTETLEPHKSKHQDDGRKPPEDEPRESGQEKASRANERKDRA
jgi:hypothetical protein